MRLAIVFLRMVKRLPFLVFAQMCVKTRKSNVSGLPSPRAARSFAAKRPNSMSGFSCIKQHTMRKKAGNLFNYCASKVRMLQRMIVIRSSVEVAFFDVDWA